MANSNEWRAMLAQRGWINDEGKLIAAPDTLLRVLLPEGRSFVVRPGKSSPDVRLEGEFLVVQEFNVDSAGHTRTTTVSLSFVESFDSLS